MAVRLYNFEEVPKWSREQVAIQESLARYYSYRPFSIDFAEALASDLEAYLKVPCRFSAPDMQTVSGLKLGRLVPSVAVMAVVGAGPTEHKIVADIDPALVSFCIDRLLGGSGETGRIRRPLTDIEEGVISFVVLRVLAHFAQTWSGGQGLSLTLDRFASSMEDLEGVIATNVFYPMLGLRVSVGKKSGYARIVLPPGLLTESFMATVPQGPTTPDELEHMRRNLWHLGQRSVDARVEVATVDLAADDIANLEAGDIVLFENHQVSKQADGLVGEAFLRIGLGLNGGVQGRIFNEGDQSKLEITAIVAQEQPPEAEMADADGFPPDDGSAAADPEGSALREPPEGPPELPSQRADKPAAPNDNLQETAGLLRDIDAPVVVELGRLKMNANQVARLRVGQVLRLPRGPSEPVNLVVNDKLFARGELIEVDGELGVRLLQVAGQA